VFRSATSEAAPLLNQRTSVLREAAQVLQQVWSNLDLGNVPS
jgi:hypothetical protein